MSFVIAVPEFLSAAATDLANLGSTISAANAAASIPTTGVLAAGADDVSAAIAALFGAHAQAYQTISAQAATFHAQFVQTLSAGAGAYANAEAANVQQSLLNAINAPTQALLGRPLIGDGADGTAPGQNGGAGGLLYGNGGNGAAGVNAGIAGGSGGAAGLIGNGGSGGAGGAGAAGGSGPRPRHRRRRSQITRPPRRRRPPARRHRQRRCRHCRTTIHRPHRAAQALSRAHHRRSAGVPVASGWAHSRLRARLASPRRWRSRWPCTTSRPRSACARTGRETPRPAHLAPDTPERAR